MYMVEITEDKFSCLSEDIEKGLKYLGKAMQCLEDVKQEKSGRERFGERYGYREDSGEREMYRRGAMGNRYDRY